LDALTSAISGLRAESSNDGNSSNNNGNSNNSNNSNNSGNSSGNSADSSNSGTANSQTAPPVAIPGVGINNPFADVRQSDWFYDDAMFAYSHGLMSGTGAAEFSPDMPTTRGMIVTVLHRLESEPGATVESVFGDVASGEYYTKAIAWAAQENLVEGFGDGMFGPDTNITRQDMAVILLRYADYKRLKLPVVRTYAAFADDAGVSGYARAAVTAMHNAGIMDGRPNNRLDPTGMATRAEAAAMLRRFLGAASG
jgi:hypothetical protein